MPINPKLADLLTLLKSGTEARRLQWQTTPDENTFRLSVAGGSMRLSKNSGYGPSRRYALTILDHGGQLIDDYAPEEGEEEDSLAELFGIARRSALKLDDVFDQMLQELKRQVG